MSEARATGRVAVDDPLGLALVAHAPADPIAEQRALRNAEHALLGRAESEAMVVGRYRLRGRIGAGDQGVVYEAYDPDIDRRIALKVLLPLGSSLGTVASDATPRGADEARAIGRVAHPNVVPVFDVGTLRTVAGVEHRYIAMEYVEGVTLKRWLGQPRSLRAIVEAFIQLARGLAATHAAGLVHRDLKTSNGLVGHDGRVRLGDFGLARLADSGEADSGGAEDDRDTMAGDQRALCVALRDAVGRCSPRRRVPARLDVVIQRGVDSDPGARWPDVDALADALQAALRRRPAGLVAAVTGAVVLGGVLGALGTSRSAPEPCAALRERATAVWTDGRRSDLRERWPGSEAGPRVVAMLDRFAEGWHAELDGVCPEPSAADVACLAHGTARLDQLLQTLERAPDADAAAALGAATELAAEVQCRVPLPPVANPAAPAIREQLARAWALQRGAGDPRAAFGLAQHAAFEARRIGEPELRARALLAAGRSATDLGRLDAAVELSSQAQWLALREGSVPLAVEANGALVISLLDAGRPEEAMRHARRGLELVGEGDEGDSMAAAAHTAMAQALSEAGHLADAENHAERALARLRAEAERNANARADAAVGRALVRLGNIRLARADAAAALEAYDEAAAVVSHGEGDDAPDSSDLLLGRGHALAALGRLDEAEAPMAAAASQLEAIDPAHPDLVAVYGARGTLSYQRQRWADAERWYGEALRIATARFGPSHPELGDALVNHANARSAQGAETEEVRAKYLRALSIYERTHGKSHPLIADTRTNLADEYRTRGEFRAAAAEYERALAIYGDAHARSMVARLGLGTTYAELDDPRAHETLAEAFALVRAAGLEPESFAPAWAAWTELERADRESPPSEPRDLADPSPDQPSQPH